MIILSVITKSKHGNYQPGGYLWYFSMLEKNIDIVFVLMSACHYGHKIELNITRRRYYVKEQDRQFSMFSDVDFTPRNVELIQSTEPKHDIGITLLTGNCSIDCFYYVAAGICHIHGDASGCDECDDYKSINEENIQDDD
ncbi:hypothetical protein ACFLV6_00235 [Chloroflexota bacterium]